MKRSIIITLLLFISLPGINEMLGSVSRKSLAYSDMQQKSGTGDDILKSYIGLKNALANDGSGDAAKQGASLVNAFKNYNEDKLNADQKKNFEDIAEDVIENAGHISDNAGKIAHQREHFVQISRDVYDFVKAFGAGQVLYKIFCPMYDGGKGAYWLSETREIKNPYFGKSMTTCGTVSEEIK